MADNAESTRNKDDVRRARKMRNVKRGIWIARLGVGLWCTMVVVLVVMAHPWRSFHTVMLVLSVLNVAVSTLMMMSSAGHLRELKEGRD